MALAFFTAFMESTLIAATHLLVDCTFNPVPAPFTQLLIALALHPVTHMFVPVIYVLLRDKKATTYEQVFQWMRMTGANPKYVTVDFEVCVCLSCSN